VSFADALSDAITPWIHIVAVSVWLGPQFFMFLVTVPALRAVDDAEARLRILRVINRRFGWLAWGAMIVIVLTGISNIFQVGADAPFDLWSTDFKFFHLFSLKMTLLAVVVLLTAVHTFVVGPQQMRLHEEMRGDAPEMARLRRASMILSILSLTGSMTVVLVAMILGDHDYSWQPT